MGNKVEIRTEIRAFACAGGGGVRNEKVKLQEKKQKGREEERNDEGTCQCCSCLKTST